MVSDSGSIGTTIENRNGLETLENKQGRQRRSTRGEECDRRPRWICFTHAQTCHKLLDPRDEPTDPTLMSAMRHWSWLAIAHIIFHKRSIIAYLESILFGIFFSWRLHTIPQGYFLHVRFLTPLSLGYLWVKETSGHEVSAFSAAPGQRVGVMSP